MIGNELPANTPGRIIASSPRWAQQYRILDGVRRAMSTGSGVRFAILHGEILGVSRAICDSMLLFAHDDEWVCASNVKYRR